MTKFNLDTWSSFILRSTLRVWPWYWGFGMLGDSLQGLKLKSLYGNFKTWNSLSLGVSFSVVETFLCSEQLVEPLHPNYLKRKKEEWKKNPCRKELSFSTALLIDISCSNLLSLVSIFVLEILEDVLVFWQKRSIS